MDINIDITGWSQNEINLIISSTVSILFKNNLHYDSVSFKSGVLSILNPSSDPSILLDSNSIKQEASLILSKAESVMNEAIIEDQKCRDEFETNDIANSKIDDLQGMIDSIKTIDDVKNFLLKLSLYSKARKY